MIIIITIIIYARKSIRRCARYTCKTSELCKNILKIRTESILSMVHWKEDPPLLRLHNFAVFPHVFKPICVSFDELFYNSSIQFVYVCPLYEDIKFVFHIFSKSLHMFARQYLTPNVLWKLQDKPTGGCRRSRIPTHGEL